MTNKREEIQSKATKAIIDADYHGIIDIAPRVGNLRLFYYIC